MSFKLIRSQPFTQRRCIVQYRKVESYHPDGPIFRTPIVGAAPRVAQGLDMNKLTIYPWIPFWKTREKYSDDYKYGQRNSQPNANAMTPEELVTYFDIARHFKKWSFTELFRIVAQRYFRWWLYGVTYPAVLFTCLGIYFLPSNRLEPIEYFMPVDQYYENYIWHDFGKFIDRSAYEQYLESRRAKKWSRNPDVNPVDYIPIKYRSEKQKIERGELVKPGRLKLGSEQDED